MKLQIAFDYLMVFIFVLLLFTIIYVSIAKQRVETSNEQSFAQLQVVAQSIASDITTAAQAGSGYNSTTVLPGELSLLEYNVSITKYGSIIVSSNTFGQTLRAYAISSAYGIVSNSSYLSSNGQYYTIPTYTGSGFIKLQNSFGTICIDYSCPSSSAQPAHLTAVTQSTQAISLNGMNNRLYLNKPGIIGAVQTVSMWVDPSSTSAPTAVQYLLDEGTPGADQNWIKISSSAISAGTDSHASNICSSSAMTFKSGQWYFITYVYTGSNLNLYVNGNILSGCSAPGASGYISNSITLGRASSTSLSANAFNGLITNVQAYAGAFTSGQVSAMYSKGIAAAPISSAALVAYYPLNGNANDYSGNGYNLIYNGSSSYPTVAQIKAYVSANNNAYAPNVLVGFSTTLGIFNSSQSTYSITNSTGVASAFLTQTASAGNANVKVTLFNGNVSTSSNLVAWWPLNNGQGANVYDLSKNSASASPASANIVLASWASPNYVMSFDGRSGYVQVPNSNSLQLSTVTMSAWVNLKGQGNGYNGYIISKQGAYGVAVCGSRLYICYYNPGTLSDVVSSVSIAPNNWYFVTAIVTGGIETVYVNGALVLSGSVTLPSQAYGLAIGQGAEQFFNGSISNAQAYSSALNQQQVTQLYSEGIGGAPLSIGTLVGWWPLSGTANDYSGSGNSGAVYGGVQNAQYVAQPSQQVAQLLVGAFNGASSVINYGNVLNNNPPLSISIWFYTTTVAPSYQQIEAKGGNAADFDLQLQGSTLYFYLFSINKHGNIAYPGIAPNTWYHTVITWNGNNITMYLNGVQVATSSGYTGGRITNTNAWCIGYNCYWPNRWFNGYLANSQFYGIALSPAQVQSLYLEGIGGLPISNGTSGLLGWWPLNGNANDDGTYGYNANAVNSVTYAQLSALPPSYTPSYSGSGLYFNGGSSNVIVSSASSMGPMPSETQTAWIYAAGLPPPSSYSQVTWQESGLGGLYIDSAGHVDFGVFPGGTFESLQAPTKIISGSWYFISGTYSAPTGVLSSCVNAACGNYIESGSLSNTGPFYIGGKDGASLFFNGTISDVQVYNTALTQQQLSQLYNAGIPQSSSLSMPLGATP